MKTSFTIKCLKLAKSLLGFITLGIAWLYGKIEKKITDLGGDPQVFKLKRKNKKVL